MKLTHSYPCPRLRSSLVLTFVIVSVAALEGCSAIGAAAYKFSGAPTIPAEYVPVKDPMVVFVQRSQNPSDAQLDAERIASYLTAELKAHGIGPLIDASSVLAVQPRKPAGSVWAAASPTATAPAALSVPEIGRAVGARQVLYVDLLSYTIEPTLAGEVFRGTIDARVRVVDAQSGMPRWPTETTQGHPVRVETPFVHPGEKMNEPILRVQMDQELATLVARLFYPWTADQVDNRPRDDYATR